MELYGIKNCNTVKKAIDWLNAHEIDFKFHDYKKQGISKEKLRKWASQVGWQNLINRKGTTWRRLDDAQKEKITNEPEAIDLMVTNTSVIKRPLIEKGEQVMILGFDEEEYRIKMA